MDDDGIVDYDMMVSLIPEQYTDRVAKMINACKHLGKLITECIWLSRLNHD